MAPSKPNGLLPYPAFAAGADACTPHPILSAPFSISLRIRGRHFAQHLACLIAVAFVFAGCATARYEQRAFFLPEKGREAHGRKTWFDHLVEFDPGGLRFEVADDYAQNPPRHIAVLPFMDHGSANFVVNKIPPTFRDSKQQAEWAWTYANRLRRALTGYLAQREFVITNLLTVDSVLADHGVTDWNTLLAVPPEQLGRWLGVDTVVYGEVNHYEAYYAFLIANWQVGVQVRMVSTHDRHEVFSAHGSRYSVDLRPAFTLIDMGINSVLTLLQLRDVNLARAEEEVSREIVLRLPIAERNVETLTAHVGTGQSQPGGEQLVHSNILDVRGADEPSSR